MVEYNETSVENDKLMFVLSELHSIFVIRLGALGIHKTLNKTRLETSLLEKFPDAEEQNDGENGVIMFKKAIQVMIKDAAQLRDFSEDALILAKAAESIRKGHVQPQRLYIFWTFHERLSKNHSPC